MVLWDYYNPDQTNLFSPKIELNIMFKKKKITLT